MVQKRSKMKNSFITSHGQVDVWLFPEEWGSIMSKRDLGKLLSSLQIPPLHLPYTLYAEHDARQCGISHWSVVVSCPVCVLSELPEHPQPTHWWGKEQKRS